MNTATFTTTHTTASLCSARAVNARGCVEPKMGLLVLNGRVMLVPQAGEKLRVNLGRAARHIGLPANACLMVGW